MLKLKQKMIQACYDKFTKMIKMIQKYFPNFKLSKTVGPGFMTRQTHAKNF